MSAQEDAYVKLLEQITKGAEATNNSANLLRLAEAYAYVIAPAQSHGGRGE